MNHSSNLWSSAEWDTFLKENPKFSGIAIQHIPRTASTIRGGIPCALQAYLESGVYHVVLKLLFADNTTWACRIRRRDPDEHPEYVKSTMESTVATMRYVKNRTTLPVPTVHHYESDPSATQINAAYMLMDFVPGHKREQNSQDITVEQLEKIYDQIADLTLKLAQLQFPLIGQLYHDNKGNCKVGPFYNRDGSTDGPFSTSVEYYRYLVERHATKPADPSLTELESKNKPFAIHLYRKATSSMDLADTGPFGLSHRDHGVHNLLWDENLVLTGILDWESACVAPVLECCNWPPLVEIRWAYIESDRPYHPPVLERILLKQKLFLEGVKKAEKRQKKEDVVKFGGKLMSEIVGSDQPIIAQILGVLDYDPTYRWYDGKRVFEYLYGTEADFEASRDSFLNSAP